ncbi:type III secretion system chaperone [Thalassomonas viridans]|uniref:Type III secretion system chaperone n=1 Tax=Thalassomonas viridans TaxID=137584 RepID=A0AAE9Z8B1_9GAMM|nr:type III secretion system chaperone [Thalassomonas viridans]WDE08606.1 type III secretion system chaperone [Thalassomonas viridans]
MHTSEDFFSMIDEISQYLSLANCFVDEDGEPQVMLVFNDNNQVEVIFDEVSQQYTFKGVIQISEEISMADWMLAYVKMLLFNDLSEVTQGTRVGLSAPMGDALLIYHEHCQLLTIPRMISIVQGVAEQAKKWENLIVTGEPIDDLDFSCFENSLQQNNDELDFALKL